MDSFTAQDLFACQMESHTKDNGKEVFSMERVLTSGLTAPHIRDLFRKELKKGKAAIKRETANCSRDSGKKEKETEKAS